MQRLGRVKCSQYSVIRGSMLPPEGGLPSSPLPKINYALLSAIGQRGCQRAGMGQRELADSVGRRILSFQMIKMPGSW